MIEQQHSPTKGSAVNPDPRPGLARDAAKIRGDWNKVFADLDKALTPASDDKAASGPIKPGNAHRIGEDGPEPLAELKQSTYQAPANRWHAWLHELRCLTGFRWIRPKMVTRTRSLIQVRRGVLEFPGKLADQEADDLKRRWQEAYAKDRHRIAVLPPDNEPAP